MTDPDTPGITRPLTLQDPYLQRSVHAQAGTEQAYCLLALHNDALYDLHEQHMLAFNPTVHPLANQESMRQTFLPGLRGTLAIADSLGCLAKHPRVRAPADHPTVPNQWLPFPYVGDILLFLVDELGIYAVNWSIKASEADFHRTFKSRRRPPTNEDRENAELRHEIERLHFHDGGIPTHHLFPSLIDENLRVNLLNMYYWYARSPCDKNAIALTDEVTEWHKEQLPRIRLMHDLAMDAARLFKLDLYDAKRLQKSAIFSRQLRIDLFRVVADNLPLYPEMEDPFVKYGSWFQRQS